MLNDLFGVLYNTNDLNTIFRNGYTADPSNIQIVFKESLDIDVLVI